MAPDGGPHLLVLARERHGAPVRLLVETYGQDPREPGIPRPLDDASRIPFAKRDMSVRIDHGRSLGPPEHKPSTSLNGV